MSRKRGNGEGSIYPVRDKNGRVVGYRGSCWVQTVDGPKCRYLSGKKREDVADKLAKALSNRADGFVFDAGDLMVGEYLRRWLTDSVRGSVRHSTYHSYRRQVERYLVPAIGRVKLRKLTHMHIQGLYWQMQTVGSPPHRPVHPRRHAPGAETGHALEYDPAQRLRRRRRAAGETRRDAADECRADSEVATDRQRREIGSSLRPGRSYGHEAWRASGPPIGGRNP